ncbi:MAG: hypothetical protein P4M11_02980 [Candidatus Pacebacteria bacterium]|nr:hypothetical protein [Candidatus Paceibacterota bacterium]
MRWTLGQQVPISTMDVALAYHCQNQDMILRVITEHMQTYAWEEVKRFGIPLWLKDLRKMRDIVESVAKAEFQRSKYHLVL